MSTINMPPALTITIPSGPQIIYIESPAPVPPAPLNNGEIRSPPALVRQTQAPIGSIHQIGNLKDLERPHPDWPSYGIF